MVSDTTDRNAAELRELLARGALHGLPRITVGDTVTADVELAVRVFLANLDHLGRVDGASPPQRRLVEDHIRQVHQAVTGAMAS